MKARLATLIALAACVSPAFASVSLRFDALGLGNQIDYVFDGNARNGYWAGSLALTDLTNSVSLVTYCADLENIIGFSQTWNAICSFTVGDATYQDAGSVYANSQATALTNNDATSLQIAIWATIYSTNLSTNTGPRFTLDSVWYSNNGAIISTAIGMQTLGLSNLMDAQLFTPDPTGAGQVQLGPVPEPATLLAAGAGLLALARRRKRS